MIHEEPSEIYIEVSSVYYIPHDGDPVIYHTYTI